MLRRIAGVLSLLAGLVAGAILLFNHQRRTRENSVAVRVAPKNGHFVDAGDVQMFVQEAGAANAPAVVLVHGTGTWSEIWRETIDALAPDHHVIAVDLPPFGYSSKPLDDGAYTREKQAGRLLAALDSLHVERFTLVGHSVGARPVVEAALVAPERVSRLILVDPALGFEPNHPSWATRALFSWPQLRTTLISSYGTNPLFLKQMFRSFVSNKDAVTEQRLEVIRRPMVIYGTTSAYGAWLRTLTVDEDRSQSGNFDNLRKLSMPAGIIWGRTDSVTPLWQGERLHSLIPDSQLIVIDGVGHIPYIEDPPRFIAALRGLL